jgi:hypothetical protein
LWWFNLGYKWIQWDAMESFDGSKPIKSYILVGWTCRTAIDFGLKSFWPITRTYKNHLWNLIVVVGKSRRLLSIFGGFYRFPVDFPSNSGKPIANMKLIMGCEPINFAFN